MAGFACKSVEEYLTAISLSVAPSSTSPLGCQFWRKLAGGQTKINGDAAFDVSNGRMGIRVVVRDEVGRVIAAKAKVYSNIADPSTGEALGAWNAVLLGCQLRLADVILEGDSFNVVAALKRNDPCLTSYGNLIDDAKQGLGCMHPIVIQSLGGKPSDSRFS